MHSRSCIRLQRNRYSRPVSSCSILQTNVCVNSISSDLLWTAAMSLTTSLNTRVFLARDQRQVWMLSSNTRKIVGHARIRWPVSGCPGDCSGDWGGLVAALSLVD